jgi:hypothetical protein
LPPASHGGPPRSGQAPSLGFYAGLILLAVLAPTVAAFGFLAVALSVVVRNPGAEDSAEERREAT